MIYENEEDLQIIKMQIESLVEKFTERLGLEKGENISIELVLKLKRKNKRDVEGYLWM